MRLEVNNMSIEQCQIDFELMHCMCENCNQEFYCYIRNNFCPHCDHANSEKAMDEGDIIYDSVLIYLNRKTMEVDVYR